MVTSIEMPSDEKAKVQGRLPSQVLGSWYVWLGRARAQGLAGTGSTLCAWIMRSEGMQHPRGRVSEVGIATCYSLDDSGLESWWDKTFSLRICLDCRNLLYSGCQGFPVVKQPRNGVCLLPYSSAEFKNEPRSLKYARDSEARYVPPNHR